MATEEYNKYDEQFTTAADAAKEYLCSTDYIIIRAFELGDPIPEDVKEKRAKARTELSENTQKKEDLWALGHVDIFPAWASGVAVAAGDRYRYGGVLYRCVQAHTPQADWEPDKTPALWTVVSLDEWPEWRQPVGAQDAYAKGDKVTHGGRHWVSEVDANVWEPGVFGWVLA